MSILPDATSARKRGVDENPSISEEFSAQRFPTGVTPRRDWQRIVMPVELFALPNSVRRVWRVLHDTCLQFRNCGVWKCDETIAAEAGRGVGLRSVQAAIKTLKRLGWIVCKPRPGAGQTDRVIWCLWAQQHGIEKHEPAGEVSLPMGLSMPVNQPEPMRRGVLKGGAIVTPRTAEICAQGAANLGHLMPETPQKSADNLNQGLIQENVNVNVALAGGKKDDTPPIEPAPVAALVAAESAPPPCPADAEIPTADAVALALAQAGKLARFPALAEEQIRIVRAAGRNAELPPRHRDHVLSEPTVAAPAPAPRVQAAAPTPPAPAATDLKSLKVETLLFRLVRRDDPEREEIIATIAGRMAWDWNDYGSIKGFKSKLRLIGPKKTSDLSARRVLNAYLSADRYEAAESKGAIFNSLLRGDMDRIATVAAGA